MWSGWCAGEEDYSQLAIDIRKLQNDLLERRVRRPFTSGVTTDGINYIDTRPSSSFNNNTVLTHHHFFPSLQSDKKNLQSLPQHQSTHGAGNSKTTGTTLVLAHGFSQGLGMWTENLDYLSSLPGVDRVVAFDWPGMGGSKRIPADAPIRSALSYFEKYRHDELLHEQNKKNKCDHSQCKITMAFNSIPGKSSQPVSDAAGSPEVTDNTGSGQTNALVAQSNPDPTNPQLESDLIQHVITDIFSPLMSYSKPETKEMFSKSIIAPTVQLFQGLSDSLSIENYISSSIQESYTPEEAVDFFIDPLIPLWKELELDEQPVLMVSHSLGAFLSCHFAHKYPGLIQGLVLASPVGVSEGMGLAAGEQQAADKAVRNGVELKVNNTGSFWMTPQLANGGSILDNTSPDMIETLLSSSAALLEDIEQQQKEDEKRKHEEERSKRRAEQYANQTASTSTSDSALTPTPTPTSSPTADSTGLVPPASTSALKPVSDEEVYLEPPSLFIGLFHSLWKLNLLQPQTILSILPASVATKISHGLALRMHSVEDPMAEDDQEVLAQYLEKLLTAPASGEYAMNSILCIDYPKSESGTKLKTLADKVAGSERYTPDDDHDLSADDRDFLNFVQFTTDFKYRLRIKRAAELEKRQSERAAQQAEDQPQSGPKNGDSGHWQPKVAKEQMANIEKEIRRPSVFARAPLSLTNILPKLSVPITLLYGDDDWLYQGDVPFIVKGLQQTKQQYQDQDCKEHDHPCQSAVGTLLDKSVVANNNTINVDTTFERRRALSMLNCRWETTMVNSVNKEKSTSHLAHKGNPAETSASLEIISNAGHHLYGNNSREFNFKVGKFIKGFTQERLESNKAQYGTQYDNVYSKSLLGKYYGNHLKRKEEEKKRSDQLKQEQLQKQPTITIAHAIQTLTNRDSAAAIAATSKDLIHGIVDGIFGLILPQPTQYQPHQPQQQQLPPPQQFQSPSQSQQPSNQSKNSNQE